MLCSSQKQKAFIYAESITPSLLTMNQHFGLPCLYSVWFLDHLQKTEWSSYKAEGWSCMVLIIQLLLSNYLKQIATPSGPHTPSMLATRIPTGFPQVPTGTHSFLGNSSIPPSLADFRLLSSQLHLTHPLTSLKSLSLVSPKPYTPALVVSVP